VRGRGRRRKDKGKIEYKRAKYMLKKIREVFHERRKCIIFLEEEENYGFWTKTR
jgi:hypothetical protein